MTELEVITLNTGVLEVTPGGGCICMRRLLASADQCPTELTSAASEGSTVILLCMLRGSFVHYQ